MRNIFLLAIMSFVICAGVGPEGKYPKDYFKLPVDRAIYLSGTFGELRPSHFHAGIDIKSINGSPGEKIMASAEGHISRIAVSPGGYGNAVYIAHTNGYTTVYAHLDRFIPSVAEYVKKQQYAQRKFRVNLYPAADQFKVAQGQLIGYLGNSGGSFGPHLHFEIRRTSDQVPINPLHFGLKVEDDRPPDVNALRVYYLDNKLNAYHTVDHEVIKTGPGKYTLADTISEGAWRVSFAIKTTDRMNGVPNRNGVYAVQFSSADFSQYGFTMDEVSFSKSRFVNAHIDYAAAAEGNGRMHRCHVLEGNALNIYQLEGSNGIVKLYEKQPTRITIHSADFNGNKSILEFYVRRSADMLPAPAVSPKYVGGPNTDLTITEEKLSFSLPKSCLYGTASIDYSTRDTVGPFYSSLHQVGHPGIPLHKYCELSIETQGLPKSLISKAFVARIDGDEIVNVGGKPSGDRIVTSVRDLGTFSISVDTIAPEITVVSFKEDMSQESSMRFKITDDMPTGGKASGLKYDARVDGEWILMEYDAKNDLLVHRFDERIHPGEHELKLEVWDDRRNTTVLRRNFIK